MENDKRITYQRSLQGGWVEMGEYYSLIVIRQVCGVGAIIVCWCTVVMVVVVLVAICGRRHNCMCLNKC